MRLFAIFLVCGLGKLSLGQVFVRVLRFWAFSIIQISLIKITNLKSKLYMFYNNNYNTELSLLIDMNCDYKFRLMIAIMKSTADIFPVPNATNTKQCN